MGWEVAATPGHTPGHVSYRLGTTIAGGDAFMTGEPFREAVAVFARCVEARRPWRSSPGSTFDLDVLC